MSLRFLFFFISQVQLALSIPNLVWGGDFQYYTGPFGVNSECKYSMMPSNQSTWYAFDLDLVQIKEIFYPLTTQTMQLSVNAPIILCQKVFLKPNATYWLSFQTYCDYRLFQMTVSATLNNITIGQIFIERDQFGQNRSSFIAQQQQNQLCFAESHSVDVWIYGDLIGLGGLLDNITLYQVQILQVLFKSSIDEINNKVILASNLSDIGESADQFKKRYETLLSGTQLVFQYGKSDDGFMQIILYPQKTFILQKIQLVQNPQYVSNLTEFIIINVTITHSQQYFYALSDRQISLISTAKPILLSITKGISSLVLFSKSFFCSYFMMSLIVFENLSIFYIFLSIQILPNFSKSIYHEMLRIFVEQGSIAQWIQKELSLETNPLQIRQQSEIVRQLVPNKRGNMAWLGQFGYSSLFWNNNCQGFFMLAFLALKVFLLKVASKYINLSTLRLDLKKKEVLKIFLVQFTNMMAGLVISAFHQIEAETENFYEKIEKILQLIAYFCCFTASIIYRLQMHTKIAIKAPSPQLFKQGLKKKNQMENLQLNQPKKTNQKPFSRFKQNENNLVKQIPKQAAKNFQSAKRRHNSISNMLLTLAIPSLTVINSTSLFLIVSGLLLVYKILEDRLHYQSERTLKKIIGGLINLVWIFHQSVFIGFFITKQILKSSVDLLQNYSQVIIVLGIFSIFTLIAGSVLEIAKVGFEFVQLLIFLVKLFKKWKDRKSKIEPNPKTKEQMKITLKEKITVQQIQKVNEGFDLNKGILKPKSNFVEQTININVQKI